MTYRNCNLVKLPAVSDEDANVLVAKPVAIAP